MEEEEGPFITETAAEASGQPNEPEAHNVEDEEKHEEKPKEEEEKPEPIIIDSDPKPEETKTPPRSPKSPKSPKRAAAKKIISPKKQQLLNNEQIDTYVNDLLNGKDPNEIPPAELDEIIPALKTKKGELSKNKKYMDANKVAAVIQNCTNAIQLNSFTESCTNKVKELVQKRAEAMADYEGVVQEWKQRFAELDEHVKEKAKVLYDDYQQKLAEFNQKGEENMQNLTVRMTPKLIELRSKEEKLAQNEFYVEAEKIKLQADKLEEETLENDRSKLAKELEAGRQNLFEKYKATINAVEQWSNDRSMDLSRARTKEIEAAWNRVNNYNKRIESATKNGIAPTAVNGFSANRVKRTDALKAVKTAALVVPKVQSSQKKSRSGLVQYRPSAAVSRRSSMK